MTRYRLRIIAAQLRNPRSALRRSWLHWAHDRIGIAGNRPGPATGRVLRGGGRTPALRSRRDGAADRAAVAEPADPAPRAAARRPAAGSHLARHPAHRG